MPCFRYPLVPGTFGIHPFPSVITSGGGTL